MSADLRTEQITLGREVFTATEPGYSRVKRIIKALRQAQVLASNDEDTALDLMLEAILVVLEAAHPDATLAYFEGRPVKPAEIRDAVRVVTQLAGLEEAAADPNGLAAKDGTGTSTTPILSPPPGGLGNTSTNA